VNKVLGLFGRNHQPDVELLSAHLDGQLDAPAAGRLEAHLRTCGACRTRLAGLGDARDALRSLPEAEPPRSFRLRRAEVEAAPRPRVIPPLVRAMPALGAAAAIVFVAVLGADLYRGGGMSSDRAASKSIQPMAAAAPNGESSQAPGAAAGSGQSADASAPNSADATNKSAGAAAPDDAPAATTAAATAQAERSQPALAYTDSADGSPNNASGGGGDMAFRIVEVLAAAVALAAVGAAIMWRATRREV
jgi:anti-sigma factor RsiW